MSIKKHTSIVFHKKIEPIKNELASVYGLKSLVSAGILLFSRQSDAAQKELVKEVNRPDREIPADDKAESAAQELLTALKESIAERPEGRRIIITSEEESKLLANFREMVSPPKEERKPARKKHKALT